MSRTLLPLAGFEVTLNGRFWVTAEFPAIREETLSWDRPVLKDPSDGDIIDFYGPCNYDPLGKEALQTQKLDWLRRINKGYND